MGAVAKLKETVTNDTLTDKGGVAFTPMKFPEPVLSYAIEPKSRGDEDKISSSLQRLQEEDPTIRSSRDTADQGTAALRPGPAAHRGDRRQAEAAVRRRSEPQAAEDPVSGDDHGRDRRARPAQEADGRPRPVRRLLHPDGAAAARLRLRVRGRHLRRRDPADVPARGREGHPGHAAARLPGRLPGRGLQGDARRRQVPRRRLERAVVQDGRPPGVQGRDDAVQADDPRADHERRGLRAVRLRGRPDGRPERAPRAASPAWTRAAA